MTKKGNFTDLTYLEEISGGDKEFIDEIVALFIAQMPKSIQEMKEGLENNDPVIIGEVAHKAKPSAIYIGNKKLEEDLRSLQELKNTRKINEESKELLQEVEEISNNVIEELKNKG